MTGTTQPEADASSPVAIAARRAILQELRTIPGVGPTIAEDLWQLGMRSLEDVGRQDPEELYERLCVHQGCRVDRCMLYVFRCAVYFATTEDPEVAMHSS